jgi:hypothetical protein
MILNLSLVVNKFQFFENPEREEAAQKENRFKVRYFFFCFFNKEEREKKKGEKKKKCLLLTLLSLPHF